MNVDDTVIFVGERADPDEGLDRLLVQECKLDLGQPPLQTVTLPGRQRVDTDR